MVEYQPGAGNVEITLGGEQLTLRPTLQAALTVSRQGGGIRGAMTRAMDMDLDTLVMVIRAGIGTDEAKRLKNLDTMVFEAGLTDAGGAVVSRVMEFLANLARGGRPVDAVDGAGDDKSPSKTQTH